MPFRSGRGPAKRPGMGAVTVYLELTLKLHVPVQNRHIHGRDARRSEREVPVHSIDAQASAGSGTPLRVRFARLARSGSPGVMIASPGMAFPCWNQSR
jgi:hypothetical protein